MQTKWWKKQTEAYLEFKAKHLEVKMGQRSFETRKPFFVVAPRSQDKITCRCRLHVETRMVFQSSLKFRRSVTAKNGQDENCPIFEHLNDMVNKTMCPKAESNSYHRKECVNRECDRCGVNKLELLNEEKDVSHNAPLVTWQKFEYVPLDQTQDGQEKKKLQLVKKKTTPGVMFDNLKSLLRDFSSHQFRASWQSKQMKDLIEHLPPEHVCCIYDYSENYSCTSQN